MDELQVHLRERDRSDKHAARLLLPPDPVTGEEARLVYIREVGLIMAGRLEPLARFGNFEVFSEAAWQNAKEA